MKFKKNILLMLISIILGIGIGILIKIGGVSPQNDLVTGNLLPAIGRIGNGLFLWVSLCTLISMLSKSKTFSLINVLAFLLSMIIANYSYSYFVMEYFRLKVVVFWVVMLIPASVMSYILWDIKTNSKIMGIKLNAIVIVFGTAVMAFDMFIYPSLLSLVSSAIITVFLYAIFLATVIIASKKSVERTK